MKLSRHPRRASAVDDSNLPLPYTVLFPSSGILLTRPHFPQLSRSRPRRRRAVHFSRLLTGECENSRLLFLGCRDRPVACAGEILISLPKLSAKALRPSICSGGEESTVLRRERRKREKASPVESTDPCLTPENRFEATSSLKWKAFQPCNEIEVRIGGEDKAVVSQSDSCDARSVSGKRCPLAISWRPSLATNRQSSQVGSRACRPFSDEAAQSA